MEVEDDSGSEEVVEGCRVRHGELWNGDVRIHYVECGDRDGELVIDPSSLSRNANILAYKQALLLLSGIELCFQGELDHFHFGFLFRLF